MQILVVTDVNMPPSIMPPKQFMWYFHRGTTCILFTLGNKCTSCYATYATYVVHSISFHTFFVQAFKIVIDSWKFSMLLLYILWDDWPIFMISASNEQLPQQLEKKPDCHNWWISKIQSGHVLNLEKMPQASVFEWYKRFKEGRESVRDDEWCERSKEVNTSELIGQRVRVNMLRF